MNLLFILITFITFILFFFEALFHFSLGKNGVAQEKKHTYINILNLFKIHIPDKSEFISIFCTVLFFSTISGLLSSYVIYYHLY